MFNRQQSAGLVVLCGTLIGLMVAFAAVELHPQIAGTIIVALAVFGVAFTATAGPSGDTDA